MELRLHLISKEIVYYCIYYSLTGTSFLVVSDNIYIYIYWKYSFSGLKKCAGDIFSKTVYFWLPKNTVL